MADATFVLINKLIKVIELLVLQITDRGYLSMRVPRPLVPCFRRPILDIDDTGAKYLLLCYIRPHHAVGNG